MKRSLRPPDLLLFFLALAATVLGLLFIFDAGYARALGTGKGALPPEFKSQIMFLGPAILVGLFCGRFGPEVWMRYAKASWVVTFVLLLVVAKFGHEMNGARRWIGFGPFTIQPAEFAKLTSVLYLAAVFATRKAWPTKISPRKDWAHWMDTIAVPKLGRALPALWVLVAVGLIEKEPDLGTGAVVAATAFAMFVPGGVTRKSVIASLAVALLGGWVMVKQEPYRLERIENHVNRWSPSNVDDTSYQTVQSELAMASGGVLGVGIGNGRAKHVIPATTTDFVMATVAEEFGLAGSLVVLGVIGGLVARILWQAQRAPTYFGQLVLYGVGAWFGVQACVNVMMANGFLPAIGIPLPFISSGGSSLVALWMAVGVCQSAIREPAPVPVAAPPPPPVAPRPTPTRRPARRRRPLARV